MPQASDFWVVVPCYNEARGIAPTLRALAAQTDQAFELLFVDNGSTDGTADAVARFFADRPERPYRIIEEPRKGTGAASDTGFRHAIRHGARFIARTDADCLPRRDWVARLRRALAEEGLEFAPGRIAPRLDDHRLSRFDRLLIPVIVELAGIVGGWRRRGPQFRYPYLLVAGNNLAITAELYERAGGFPRTAIEEAHEDRVLAERVRTLTDRARLLPDAVVYNSTRRLKRYGYRDTLLWYWDHKSKPAEVDVR